MTKNKHIALNVPTNFGEHVAFSRSKILTRNEEHKRRELLRSPDYVSSIYWKCLVAILNKETKDYDTSHMVADLLEIESRFMALNSTIDQSVAVTPLFKRYTQIGRLLRPRGGHNSRNANNQESNLKQYTLETLGYSSVEELPRSMDNFRDASTLAEKALIAEALTKEYSEQIMEIASHFNYKSKNFGRGARPTYSLLYAVLALASFFEQYSDKGTKPLVNANAPVNDNLYSDHSQQPVRYTGDFLDLVASFVMVADASLIGMVPTGFYERVRKFSLQRKHDPSLPDLLHKQEVTVEDFLEFMSRADALKKK